MKWADEERMAGRGLDRPPGLSNFELKLNQPAELAPVSNVPAVVDGWRKVRVTFDSGAAESVTPSSAFPGFEVKESRGSKMGQNYQAAGGKEIPNEGQVAIQGQTDEYQDRNVVFQVCPVTKPLFAAAQAAKAGFQTVLDEEGSYMLHKKTGQKTKLEVVNGVYVFDLWVRQDQGFAGQGK